MKKHILLLVFLISLSPNFYGQRISLYPYSDNSGILWGYMSEDFKIVHEPQFNERVYLDKTQNVVMKNYKYGLLNEKGEWIISEAFEKITNNDQIIIAEKSDSLFFYENYKFTCVKKIAKQSYEIKIMRNSSDNYLIYFPNNYVTIIGLKSGQIISENQYDSVHDFNEFNSTVHSIKIIQNSKLSNEIHRHTNDKGSHHFIVGIKGKYGFLNIHTSDINIPCSYKTFNLHYDTDPYHEVYIEAVLPSGKKHYYDENFRLLSQPPTIPTNDYILETNDNPRVYQMVMPPAALPVIENDQNSGDSQIKYTNKTQPNNTGIIQKLKVETNVITVLESIVVDSIYEIKRVEHTSDSNPVFQVHRMNDTHELINSKGVSLFSQNITSINQLYKHIWIYYENEKIGLIDMKKTTISKPIFKTLDPVYLQDRLKIVTMQNGVIGHYDCVLNRLFIPGYENKSIYDL